MANPVGRPPTGRTTKVVRIPSDMSIDKAIQIYYDWLPIILAAKESCKDKESSPRYERLVKLLDELGID